MCITNMGVYHSFENNKIQIKIFLKKLCYFLKKSFLVCILSYPVYKFAQFTLLAYGDIINILSIPFAELLLLETDP